MTKKNYILIDKEFDSFDISLLILYESSKYDFIDKTTYNVMKAVIIVTFIASFYLIINKLNTPLASIDNLCLD